MRRIEQDALIRTVQYIELFRISSETIDQVL